MAGTGKQVIKLKNIWLFEWKILMRQKSYYALILLWILIFSLLFLLQKNQGAVSGYTNVTATIVNIILYLLPLFMLIVGSFAITSELENGGWQLLCTYPLSVSAYLIGKLSGIFTAQFIIFSLSFGISMALGILVGIDFSFKFLIGIYLFSVILLFIFLLIGIFIGTIVNTRWKALVVSIAVWFFLIMIWPTALIALLSIMPYRILTGLMKIALVVNPAEFLRIFFISKWGSGAIFGQEYYSIVKLFESGTSWFLLIEYLLAFFVVFIFLSFLLLKRRQLR